MGVKWREEGKLISQQDSFAYLVSDLCCNLSRVLAFSYLNRASKVFCRVLGLFTLIFKTKPKSSPAFDVTLLVFSETDKKPRRALFGVNQLSAIFLYQTQQLFVLPLIVSILLYQNQYLFLTEQCYNAWAVAFLVICCNCVYLSGSLKASFTLSVARCSTSPSNATSRVLWVICNCWRSFCTEMCKKVTIFYKYVTNKLHSLSSSSAAPLR